VETEPPTPAPEPEPAPASPDAPGQDPPAAEAAPKTRRRRRWPSVTLVVVGAIALILGVLASWVNRVALNTDDYVDVSTGMLEDPAVREAVSVYLVDQIWARGDVDAKIQEALPPVASGLAGPASSTLQTYAVQAADRVLATDAAQTLWEAANLAAHHQLMNVINGDDEAIAEQGGVVVLDLRPLAVEIAERVGLSADVVDRLPPDAGQFVIMREDQLETVQQAAHLLDLTSFLLVFVAFVLFVIAVWIAPDRRVAVRNVGAALLIGGLVVLAARRYAGDALVDSLSPPAQYRDAADQAWATISAILRDGGFLLLLMGLAALAWAAFAGPSRLAGWLRRMLRPLAARPFAWWVVVAILLLVVLAFASTLTPSRALFALILLALIILGLETARRVALRATPRASSVWRGTRSVDALKELAELRERGLLSEEEYERAKADVLGVPAQSAIGPAAAN
jgi:hypothetical protein